jgi:predicted GIY-YIG superfamily endonuclease
MKINQLIPQPFCCGMFRRSQTRFVPDTPGCYVLTTISRIVLYIGLTDNLRRRMNEHLDDPKKSVAMELGRAVLFFWLETQETHKVERTWMNTHIQHEGSLPLLNKVYSPTTV